jgi:hypothetical protein
MPNWCANVVKISHNDSVMMDRMIDSFQKGKLLQEFIPCPKSLLKTVAGKLSDKRKQRRLERTEKRNLNRYGYKNWYNWCNANWGTKWDVEGHIEDNGDEDITIVFDSAWSPPLEAYDTLRDLGFDIKAYYYEPGMAFAGIWEDGCDSSYEVSSSAQASAVLPPELDEMFAISETLSEYETE